MRVSLKQWHEPSLWTMLILTASLLAMLSFEFKGAALCQSDLTDSIELQEQEINGETSSSSTSETILLLKLYKERLRSLERRRIDLLLRTPDLIYPPLLTSMPVTQNEYS